MRARGDATSVEAGARTLTGLTEAEAARHLEEIGPNAIPESAPPPLWGRVIRQIRGPLTLILLFAHVSISAPGRMRAGGPSRRWPSRPCSY